MSGIEKVCILLVFVSILSLFAIGNNDISASINVYSIPGGASVWIDGKNTNLTTPCTLHLTFNYDGKGNIISKNFQIRKDGYQAYSRTIRGPEDSLIEAYLTPSKS